MNSITVSRYAFKTITPQTALTAPAAFVRRMSAMQKAAMEAWTSLTASSPFPAEVPIYFATQFGEVDSTLTVATSIFNHELPVSPTAFQHSVHNAVAGYLSIASKSHAPSITVSSGFASFDKLLFWAVNELQLGMLNSVLLAHGAEQLEPGLASCELLLLTTTITPEPKFAALHAIERITSRSELKHLLAKLSAQPCQIFSEPQLGGLSTSLQLDKRRGTFRRLVACHSDDDSKDAAFEAYLSTWSCPT